VRGVWVRWAVQSGAATLSADSARTDTAGHASVRVTLGAIPGPLLIRATTGAGAAASFTATAQTHCEARVPRFIRVLSGSGQSLLTYDTLRTPLRAQVLCDSSTALPGVAVSWQVAAGAATLAAATSTTDATGAAANLFSTASTAGPVSIAATVPGAEGSAVFGATVIDRCDARQELTAGDRIDAGIVAVDCARNQGIWENSRYAVYSIRVSESRLVRIGMHNPLTGTRPYVKLWNEDETTLLAERFNVDDFGGFERADAVLFVSLEPGVYHYQVGAAPAGISPFTLRIDPVAAISCPNPFGDQALLGVLPVYVHRQTIHGSLSARTCWNFSSASGGYYDLYFIRLDAGEQVSLSLESAFNASLVTGEANPQTNSYSVEWFATGTSVSHTLQAAASGFYAIRVDGAPGATGSYTLRIE
jgi:hypothetical protein